MYWLLFILLGESMDIRVQTIENKKYVCFDETSSRDLLELRLLIPTMQEQTELLEKRTALQELQIAKWSSAYDGLREQNSVLIENSVRQQEEIDQRQVWYRSTVFWGVVGLVVGASLGVGTLYGVQKIK